MTARQVPSCWRVDGSPAKSGRDIEPRFDRRRRPRLAELARAASGHLARTGRARRARRGDAGGRHLVRTSMLFGGRRPDQQLGGTASPGLWGVRDSTERRKVGADGGARRDKIARTSEASARSVGARRADLRLDIEGCRDWTRAWRTYCFRAVGQPDRRPPADRVRIHGLSVWRWGAAHAIRVHPAAAAEGPG